jgi:excisionase family DNA binding protein
MIENVEKGLEAKYYTVREIAELIHRQPATVWGWLREGRIGHCRVGGGRGSIVVPASELAKFLNSGFVAPRNENAETGVAA